MTRQFGDIRPGGDWQFGPTENVSEPLWREAKQTNLQLLNTYDRLMPGEDHGVRPLSEVPGVDWASLEGALIGCMLEGLRANASLHPRQYGALPHEDGWLAVTADHVVDDYWWVECGPAEGKDPGDIEAERGSVPAVAILRISGSREHLPYDGNNSLRIA